MTIRRMIALGWAIAVFALMSWCWYSYSGPYRWAAEWQLKQFGSYEVELTLVVPLLVLLIPAGFIGGWGRPKPRPVMTPEARVAAAKRNAGIAAALGLFAVLVGAAAGGVGYLRARMPPSYDNLVLNTGAEPAPSADLVVVTGTARTDMIVTLTETISGMTEKWSFVPLVGASWRSGDTVRFLLRTNQNAWIPPGGVGPGSTVHMLTPGSPPFRMTTEPSVLARNDVPGVVRTEYEKAHVALDPAAAVVRQGADEMLTPYWAVAFGGGLVGFILLLTGLIGALTARKAAGPSGRR
jgi:hypothetical protein